MKRENLLLPGLERWPAEEPVIVLDGVYKSFGGTEVLRDLSLTVETGKTTVIAGESGSGKSVLLRLMNGLTFADEGRVLLFGEDLKKISKHRRSELRKRCTMVFQSYALIDSFSVAENIAFPILENTRIKPPEVYALVRDLLEMLELGEAMDFMPASLSGGMKKRVALARAVISNPEVVLFDEPTTGLDPVMIEFVDELIRRTQREYEISSVIISHDMASNRRLADKMAILAEGSIVEVGRFEEVLESKQPQTRRFMANVVTERLGALESQEPLHQEEERAIVQVSGLHKRFGANHVLKGIDLSLPERKISVVIGGSGSGKSVLIKHIIGLFQPTEGRVEVFGKDLAQLSGEELRQVQSRIGMLFQGAALFDSMNVWDNLAFPLVEGRRRRRRDVRDLVEAMAERLKVAEILQRFPAEISGGQRKRVGLARALITEPEIMIYDEPTTGQDPIMMRRVDDMIVETAENFEISSIVISHDMVSTFRIADKIALIYKGELLAAGSPDMLRACPDEQVRRFIFAGTERN